MIIPAPRHMEWSNITTSGFSISRNIHSTSKSQNDVA